MTQDIQQRCEQSARNFQRLAAQAPAIRRAAGIMLAALNAGGKIILCGNGGSAADSQHLAAEFSGRFLRERAPLPALALTTDTSALTAIANDYGYAHVFARQLRGIGRADDALLAISTSGKSENVTRAAQTAKEMGIAVVALTGESGGDLAAACDALINVPAARADLVQEMHIAVGHMLCGIVEEARFGGGGKSD